MNFIYNKCDSVSKLVNLVNCRPFLCILTHIGNENISLSGPLFPLSLERLNTGVNGGKKESC